MSIYTIGFTQKKAQSFFHLIKENNVKKVIDVRLNNISQLAGFAKRDDLIYFLKEICQCDYFLPVYYPLGNYFSANRNNYSIRTLTGLIVSSPAPSTLYHFPFSS